MQSFPEALGLLGRKWPEGIRQRLRSEVLTRSAQRSCAALRAHHGSRNQTRDATYPAQEDEIAMAHVHKVTYRVQTRWESREDGAWFIRTHKRAAHSRAAALRAEKRHNQMRAPVMAKDGYTYVISPIVRIVKRPIHGAKHKRTR